MKYLKWFLCLVFLFLFLAGCTKEIEVQFNTGTSEVIKPLIVKKGESLSKLPTPVREGYDFDSWYLDDKYTEVYENQAIKETTVLYANWKIKKFTVVFKSGNLTVHTVTVDYGQAATPPTEDPTRIGHTFTNWDKAFDQVTENMVVNACFKINVFTVKFKDGDTIIDEQEVPFNGKATAPTPPEKEGYDFVEWDQDFDVITDDLVVNAYYEPIYFNVTFVDSDDTVLSSDTIRYGEDAVAPNQPSKNGYLFTGWNLDFKNIKEDLTVTAEYQVVTYTITYYDGDNLLTHIPASYDIENGIEIEGLGKEGLEFVGWYLDSVFTGEPITSIPSGNTGNRELYGRWANVSNIVYELNGGNWYFTANSVTDATNGIDAFSNLPEILMIDIYTYLKDKNLLTSSIVASKLHKTTWATFSANYDDPVALYNWTSSNTSKDNDGYSQFFLTEGTGNATTGELLTIEGGFFGTEPYKSKYLHLIELVSLMQRKRYNVNLWDAENGKSLAGFVLDGYLYGTQSILDATYEKLRKTVPQPNKGYRLEGNNLVSYDVTYPLTKHLDIQKTYLSLPHKEGYAFGGWYVTSDFSGDRVYFLNPTDAPAEKYFAKWIAIENY
ncbi:MAG: InlB B-repeat-containing protein [Bacilli bacterium]|nr:InlB B-repeat-containing protein [Bacilli bacterium]